MRAVFASFGAALLAVLALSVQATPSEQQQIEIDHCTIMSKAVLEFAKARDQGLAKMDAYNSVTGNQPYRAGSMVDQTLQWAYDHSDENAEAASAHFYGHCSLDALEALTPQTEEQAKGFAGVCQQQNAARPDETRICMDQKISALMVAANGPGLAPTSATAVAPRPARSKVQTLSSSQLPVASAPSVRAPVAPVEPAPETPAPQLAQTPVPSAAPMPIPAPVRAKPAVPAAASAPVVAKAPAPKPLEPTLVAASQPAEAAAPELLAQGAAVSSIAPAPVKAPEPAQVAAIAPPLPAPTVTANPKPAAAPVAVAQTPVPVTPPLPLPQPTPVAPAPQPVLAQAPKPVPVTAAPQPEVAQAPAPVAPAPLPVVAKVAAPAPTPEPAKLAVAAPATTANEPKLAVLSPPSLAGIGKLTLGMTMADAMHTFHSFGEEDRDEFGAQTQTFVISDGHGYVVLLTEKGKPDTLYGIEYHGGADADTAPTIMGVRLGQSALAVLTHVGDPSRRERLPDSEFTRWYYDGRNYSFDISSGGDLVAIRLYGYQGLQAPDADSDAPGAAPVTP